jgi:hypothetical protein
VLCCAVQFISHEGLDPSPVLPLHEVKADEPYYLARSQTKLGLEWLTRLHAGLGGLLSFCCPCSRSKMNLLLPDLVISLGDALAA